MTTLAYLDTNALVKLYLPEEGGQQVIDLLDEVDGVVTSVLSYPETLSVFARALDRGCLLYTSPSPRERQQSRMPSSA